MRKKSMLLPRKQSLIISVPTIKSSTSLPVAVGFGIKTNEDVKKTKLYADGAIVGTEIVKLTNKYSPNERLKGDLKLVSARNPTIFELRMQK